MPDTVQPPTIYDTGQQHAGHVYAKALLGAALQAGLPEQLVQELDALVHDVLDRLPKLEATLASPRVPVEAKYRMLDRAFGGTMSVLLLNFLKVVCRHRRFDCLRAINRAAREQYQELLGRVDVRITTARALTPELRTAVLAQLEARLGARVNLFESVDANVIGGMVVRVGDTVYDASVANRLVRLRKEVLERTAQTIKEALQRFEIAE